MCMRTNEQINEEISYTNKWLGFKSIAVRNAERERDMVHDPNRFMKGFAMFVRESWHRCMRCSPWKMTKEMSTDNPEPQKIARRIWGPVRWVLRRLTGAPCLPSLAAFVPLCSADVTVAARHFTLIGDHSGPQRLIFIRLDSNRSKCHGTLLRRQLLPIPWPGMVSAGAKFCRCGRFPGPLTFEYFPYLSIIFVHIYSYLFPSKCGFQVRGECPLDAGHALCVQGVCQHRHRVSCLLCYPGQPEDHCVLPRRAVVFPFKPHVWRYTKLIFGW